MGNDIKISIYKSNLILASILTLFFLFPDILANYSWHGYGQYTLISFVGGFAVTFLFAYLLTYIHKTGSVLFSLFVTLMGFIQIVYYAFFRTYMHAYDWSLIVQTEAIVSSLKSVIITVVIAIVMMIVFLTLLLILEKFSKPRKNIYAKYFLLFFVIFFLFLSQLHKDDFQKEKYFSSINTIRTFFLACWHYTVPFKEKSFAPYKIIKSSTQKPIVIVIMGESLNVNEMHLFGSEYQDTPLLDGLKSDKNFQYKRAISGGVNTVIGVPTFFYLKREPQNSQLIKSATTNLFDLAKENGYKTYWLSTHNEGKEIRKLLTKADFVKTRKHWNSPVYDEQLVHEIKSVDLSQKSFVVLHLRANHSPYEEYTPRKFYQWDFKSKEYAEYKRSSYLDSVLYIDHIVSSVIDYMNKNHKNFVIYFTSDHGEMMGTKREDFIYGHSKLDIRCAEVPFIYYSDIKSTTLPYPIYSHYDISKMVASDLGYKIINPNENGFSYVNGVNKDGKWGFIRYKLPKNNENISYQNISLQRN